uniref:PCIF1 WW domain-containing protein n=1 Tax=Chromera velia CCMP2878 TaxID=1169474 RepID=A0A0G4F1F9_9ALVE|eukprot:Cvel_14518.t1-p1 / transcript=Cvel_14518.t1 / gene=Cvel_14518 / organism=Chromera_velia_CCMP2878 / gene_product=Phosphorylated CTD-interacting factor 1, putative / transcript_product=Phosphorylated CTD-interacting factor 1, putative / location=Cvel_scaffold1036:42439-51954(+) / protein_length=1508 / sequence_SO=supercontig / SO=protein_coding / is_pseudo=false
MSDRDAHRAGGGWESSNWRDSADDRSYVPGVSFKSMNRKKGGGYTHFSSHQREPRGGGGDRDRDGFRERRGSWDWRDRDRETRDRRDSWDSQGGRKQQTAVRSSQGPPESPGAAGRDISCLLADTPQPWKRERGSVGNAHSSSGTVGGSNAHGAGGNRGGRGTGGKNAASDFGEIEWRDGRPFRKGAPLWDFSVDTHPSVWGEREDLAALEEVHPLTEYKRSRHVLRLQRRYRLWCRQEMGLAEPPGDSLDRFLLHGLALPRLPAPPGFPSHCRWKKPEGVAEAQQGQGSLPAEAVSSNGLTWSTVVSSDSSLSWPGKPKKVKRRRYRRARNPEEREEHERKKALRRAIAEKDRDASLSSASDSDSSRSSAASRVEAAAPHRDEPPISDPTPPPTPPAAEEEPPPPPKKKGWGKVDEDSPRTKAATPSPSNPEEDATVEKEEKETPSKEDTNFPSLSSSAFPSLAALRTSQQVSKKGGKKGGQKQHQQNEPAHPTSSLPVPPPQPSAAVTPTATAEDEVADASGRQSEARGGPSPGGVGGRVSGARNRRRKRLGNKAARAGKKTDADREGGTGDGHSELSSAVTPAGVFASSPASTAGVTLKAEQSGREELGGESGGHQTQREAAEDLRRVEEEEEGGCLSNDKTAPSGAGVAGPSPKAAAEKEEKGTKDDDPLLRAPERALETDVLRRELIAELPFRLPLSQDEWRAQHRVSAYLRKSEELLRKVRRLVERPHPHELEAARDLALQIDAAMRGRKAAVRFVPSRSSPSYQQANEPDEPLSRGEKKKNKKRRKKSETTVQQSLGGEGLKTAVHPPLPSLSVAASGRPPKSPPPVPPSPLTQPPQQQPQQQQSLQVPSPSVCPGNGKIEKEKEKERSAANGPNGSRSGSPNYSGKDSPAPSETFPALSPPMGGMAPSASSRASTTVPPGGARGNCGAVGEGGGSVLPPLAESERESVRGECESTVDGGTFALTESDTEDPLLCPSAVGTALFASPLQRRAATGDGGLTHAAASSSASSSSAAAVRAHSDGNSLHPPPEGVVVLFDHIEESLEQLNELLGTADSGRGGSSSSPCPPFSIAREAFAFRRLRELRGLLCIAAEKESMELLREETKEKEREQEKDKDIDEKEEKEEEEKENGSLIDEIQSQKEREKEKEKEVSGWRAAVRLIHATLIHLWKPIVSPLVDRVLELLESEVHHTSVCLKELRDLTWESAEREGEPPPVIRAHNGGDSESGHTSGKGGGCPSADSHSEYMEIRFKDDRIPLSVLHFTKMKALYERHNRESDPENEKLARRLYILVRRYVSFIGIDPRKPGNLGGNMHAAAPENVFKWLHANMAVSFEGFASPLNCFFPRFCSAFPDTDRWFGSQGSFFDFWPKSGHFEVGPPYTEEVMQAAAEHLLELLEAARDSSDPLSFTCFVPDWHSPPCPALEFMESERFGDFLKAREVAPGRAHQYISGVQFMLDKGSEKRYYVPPHGTRAYVYQNAAAAEALPITVLFKRTLLKQMCNVH